MKKIIALISVIVFSINTYASSSSDAIAVNIGKNVATTAAAAAFTATMTGTCNFFNPYSCAMIGVGLSLLSSLADQYSDSRNKYRQLSGSEYQDGPVNQGFCLTPTASSCTADAIDQSLIGTSLGNAIADGDSDQVNKLINGPGGILDNARKALAENGYKLDEKAGTLTGPNGKTQNLSALANDPKKGPFANGKKIALEKKLKSIDKGSANKVKSKRLKIVDSYIQTADGSRQPASAKSNNDDLLAAMGDTARKGAVGVAGDDIFKMIHRRYQKKMKSKEFILK